MHTTIAAAADWQFEASLTEANCKRVREYWSNIPTYMINGQFFLWGPLFVGAPVWPNMPKSASDENAGLTKSGDVTSVMCWHPSCWKMISLSKIRQMSCNNIFKDIFTITHCLFLIMRV